LKDSEFNYGLLLINTTFLNCSFLVSLVLLFFCDCKTLYWDKLGKDTTLNWTGFYTMSSSVQRIRDACAQRTIRNLYLSLSHRSWTHF